MKNILANVLIITVVISSWGQNSITSNLNFDKVNPISPYIYGFNQDHQEVTDNENWSIRRLGGNRLTVFNWENGASNSGHDNPQYTNDNRIPSLVGVPWADKDKAGEAYRFFHQENKTANIESILTLPILGWVAADKNGSNLTNPPSSRWDELVFEKGSSFSLSPNLTDGKVYLDESYNFLLDKFGNSSTVNGVKYIALDNEPALWDNTHPLIQPNPPTITEYVSKLIAAAKIVKTMDPNVKIIVGEFAGINIYDFSNATDWPTLGAGYDWFPSFLLDTLKKASDDFGMPLVDVFSFHYYPQHKIDANGNFSGAGTKVLSSTQTTDVIRETRMNFSRSLWDETYIEPSWLTSSKLGGESNMILKRLQGSIDTYFPDVKIMIGEFDYGHDTDISHGIGLADFLGVACQYEVDIATRWDLNPNNGVTFTNSAYQLFRNYDGLNSGFGSHAVFSEFDNKNSGSIWASLNETKNELHLIILNKDASSELDFTIHTNDLDYDYSFQELYAFNGSSTNLISLNSDTIQLSGNNITGTMKPMMAYHLVLKRSSVITATSGNKSVDHNLTVFPNPTKGVLTINDANPNTRFEVYSTSAKKELIGQYSKAGIDLSNLPKGLYFIKIEGQVLKVVKD